MTKPKKFQYRIQYQDNTYQIVDWTKPELQSVFKSMCMEKTYVKVDEDVFRVSDIRAIVFLPPMPEPTPEEKKAAEEQELTEWGGYDADTIAWLRQQGIDVSKGVN
jgi:hypothetical protein